MAPPPRPPRSAEADLRFSNISDHETVFQRLLIVEGSVGKDDGSIQVQHDPQSRFATQKWEVNGGYFKALVPLSIGQNKLTFTYHANEGSLSGSVVLHLTYVRPNSLPLHLAIVAASDSPVWQSVSHSHSSPVPKERGRSVASILSKAWSRLDVDSTKRQQPNLQRALVDSPPGPRREKLQSGGLAEIKRRIALQAYLWQAFHAEQMRRLGMGRRTFQLDDIDAAEEAAEASRELSSMPRVHLLRSRHPLKEFRDPDNAQQNSRARDGGAMHTFAREALEDPSTPRFLHFSPVAVLTLDTVWDSDMKLLRAHGAVGSGGQGQISLGVMGSHWLWAAPSSLDQVANSFLDSEATHESCVNDLNECPTAWQTLNIGSGAFFHEAGHALNNPHWPSGVMARGYVEFNRAFMTREPGCSRNGVSKIGFFAPIHAENDDRHFHLHQAQAVRARWHPSCRLPTDPPLPHLASTDQGSWIVWNENEPVWTSTAMGAILTSASGIGVIEVDYNDEHRKRYEWLYLTDKRPEECPPKQLVITPAQLSSLVGFDVMSPSSPSIKLNALACNMRQAELSDYRKHGVARPLTIPGIDPSRLVTKSIPLGSPSNGDRQWSLIFPHERDDLSSVRPVLRSIAIYSGACFDGLNFIYSDGHKAVFGPCGGSPHIVNLDSNESIAQIKVRAGAWIDAVEIVLSSGRTSGMRGNTTGGSLRALQPHFGIDTPAKTSDGKIVGLYGSSGAWMDSIGIFTSSS